MDENKWALAYPGTNSNEKPLLIQCLRCYHIFDSDMMEKYIDSEKSLPRFCPYCGAKKVINDFTAEWGEEKIPDGFGGYTIEYQCSKCLNSQSKNSNYCPCCGSKMKWVSMCRNESE